MKRFRKTKNMQKKLDKEKDRMERGGARKKHRGKVKMSPGIARRDRGGSAARKVTRSLAEKLSRKSLRGKIEEKNRRG